MMTSYHRNRSFVNKSVFNGVNAKQCIKCG